LITIVIFEKSSQNRTAKQAELKAATQNISKQKKH
jgi:hypothetical protein